MYNVEVLELHIQQPDGFKDENVTEDTNGGITETKDEPEVKRKKSIKERLDPLSEEDDQLELTKVEILYQLELFKGGIQIISSG